MESISEFMSHFKKVFTRPSFVYFERMVKGFLEVHQPKAVTELNQHKPPEEHFGSIYDFLKYYAWYSCDLANALLDWLQSQLQPESRVILAIDDTKNFKPHAKVIEGVCWHAEHHRVVQTKVKSKEGEELIARGVVGQRGHCWVVIGLLHQLSAGHWCCFPLRADVFVRQKYCPETFRDKLQIADHLLNDLSLPENTLLVGDNFYGAARLVNAFKGHVLSHLKSTAVGYLPPEPPSQAKRGRPKKYGEKIPLITTLDDPNLLKVSILAVYGQEQAVQMASCFALLKGHAKLTKILLIKGLRKSHFLLFTTDLSLTNEQMLEYYAARFQIEITFRELKQDLGAFRYRLKSKASFGRYLHIAFVAYALIKYLAIQGEVKPRVTDWYHPKGLASPARVQQAVAQYFQASRIFEGLMKSGLLFKNTSLHDFMRVLTG